MHKLFMVLALIAIFHSNIYAISFRRDTITLSGDWKYNLIGAPASIPGEGIIKLPGTLDSAHKSVYNPESDNTTQMRREFSFTGEATYARRVNIPQTWEGKNIQLKIERTKPTTIFIDGKRVGSNSRISSPQKYDLSEFLTPGSHKIEVRVNNADSLPPIVSRSSHAASESTQTNWNGMLGEIILEASDPCSIKNVSIKENVSNDAIETIIYLNKPASKPLTLHAGINGKEETAVSIKKGSSVVKISIPYISCSKLWSSRDPNLLTIELKLAEGLGDLIDQYSISTGVRKFETDGNGFNINGTPVFLRGTVNAAVFPNTAYAPLDYDTWKEHFQILKEYGINHVRFHSWTPPDAAFKAADNLGIYIQTELPMWGELDRDLTFTNRFLKEDLAGIMEEYNKHPSFVMFSPGNELWGDISLMGDYMKEAKKINPRILSTYGSNVYLGMNGEIGGEDFIVAAKTSDETDKSVRGSVSFADSSTGGHFNSTKPESQSNFSIATQNLNVPVVAHETGQYQIYPDFSDIDKYSGALKPDNFSEFKKRAIEAGTYDRNKKFVEASGKWAAKLYKAEMEMAQRSPGIAGYQLFGLQDYPGQGTALVGILNSLMQDKGVVDKEEWRQSSSDIMLLAEFPAFTFSEGETIEIPVITINYTETPEFTAKIDWHTEFRNGSIDCVPGTGVMVNDPIFLKLPNVDIPKKFTLSLKARVAEASNSYDFWVYPLKTDKINNVTVTDNLYHALLLLKNGERVLLCPDSLTSAEATIDPLFVNDFWNYRMYRTICDEMGLKPSPGTLGLLIDNKHASLSKFPTDNHTDWQWYSIISNSRPLIIDRLPKNVNPIIEVIDNVERNFRLALMLECNVGKGKLIILSADLNKLLESPEGRWLLSSVEEYLGSKYCKPEITLTPEQVVNLVTKPSTARKVKELKNETYNSRWD